MPPVKQKIIAAEDMLHASLSLHVGAPLDMSPTMFYPSDSELLDEGMRV